MTTEEDEQRMSIDQEKDGNNSRSSSENEDSGEEEEEQPLVEWLATSRAKRSTAGNRMKSMLAAEQPDDELELLFAEDGDDAGFTDVEDDGSDVQMDSSSDEEDPQHNGEEDEGEKELERQARESRQAARKRKAQEAIPLKFRKKVKINMRAAGPASAPPPRPKKKSERTSWLPSPADMPTRASKRETTMLSKEQLHQQMIEREVKRLKQVEAMERKAKKMEALKKPPMTQAERLAEAAIVEKRNEKSLNRWEEAEKQREEERRTKLAALNNRKLDGPVVTFWSGMGEWVDGKLKHVGKIVTIEDKPVKKKQRVSLVGAEETSGSQSKDQDAKNRETKDVTAAPSSATAKPVESSTSVQSEVNTVKEDTSTASGEDKLDPALNPAQKTEKKPESTSASDLPSKEAPPQPESQPSEPKVPDMRPAEPNGPEMKPPDMRPPDPGLYTTSMFAPPQQVQVMKPPESKTPSNTFLAPPPGATRNGLSMPMIGYSPTNNKTSNVLAPPNTAHKQSPLSMPQTNIHHPLAPCPSPARPTQTSAVPAKSQAASKPLSNLKSTQTNATKKRNSMPAPIPPPPSPPANGKATRNCIILQNFDENVINQKEVQTRILFGKDMNKLGKQAPPPKCVITNHPARYKDPKTGLPYSNGYAFKEIQKLQRGDYQWSRLVGAWVGTGSRAARGVPARFLDPKAPGPPKKTVVKEEVDNTPGLPAETAPSRTPAPVTPSAGNPVHTIQNQSAMSAIPSNGTPFQTTQGQSAAPVTPSGGNVARTTQMTAPNVAGVSTPMLTNPPVNAVPAVSVPATGASQNTTSSTAPTNPNLAMAPAVVAPPVMAPPVNTTAPVKQ